MSKVIRLKEGQLEKLEKIRKEYDLPKHWHVIEMLLDKFEKSEITCIGGKNKNE